MIPKRLVAIAAVMSLSIGQAGAAPAGDAPPRIGSDSASNIQVVGRNPLFNRGMNAALAIYDHFVYVGNRTDGSSTCVRATGVPTGTNCAHPHPGILILDVSKPARPSIVGELGAPHAGKLGITTRELRVWPRKKLLILMNFRCSLLLHACKRGTDAQFPYDLAFFDLSDPIHPKYVSSYVPTSRSGRHVKPHEMFLWIDPKNAERALLYLSTPTTSTDPALPNLIVADICRVSKGEPASVVAVGNWNGLYPGTKRPGYPVIGGSKGTCGPYDCNLFVHSMGVSTDGTRTFLAMEAGQFLVLDTSSVARDGSPGRVLSLNGDLITAPANRPVWQQRPLSAGSVPENCRSDCANGHSAVKVPGRPLVLTTDEVYGKYSDSKFGCPWGWERLIDVSEPAHPSIVGEYKVTQNLPAFCGSPADDAGGTEQFTSYSTHNPTVLPDLAIVTWHSAGLQVTDISRASHPTQAGFFSPQPLATVATEDPALSRGRSKVVFWSYPIIKDGLIYLIDVRNGLFILRYTGPHADEVNGVKFLEGNSNVGDAARLDGAARP